MFLRVCFFLSFIISAPAFAQDPVLQKIENYLNQLKTLEADLIQENPDGSLSEGRFYLSRPNKMRLSYKPPCQDLIVANGESLIHYNREMQEATEVPIDSTPAFFILQENISFEKEASVKAFRIVDTVVQIALQKEEDPEAGTLFLTFSKEPLALKGWVIEDNDGKRTRVSLKNLKEGGLLNPSLFILKN